MYWIHAKRNYMGKDTDKAELAAKHKERWPRNNLSATVSVDGSEAIVKIDADPSWIEEKVIGHPQVIRVYTEADHSEIFNFFYTPQWQEGQI